MYFDFWGGIHALHKIFTAIQENVRKAVAKNAVLDPKIFI